MDDNDQILQEWVTKLLMAFELADVDVDIHAVLNLAGVAAHQVVRPAAPLTTFVASEGRRGGKECRLYVKTVVSADRLRYKE
mgnify:CR=1 FL=1